MKNAINNTLLVLVLCATGCTQTEFRDFRRISFLQRMEFQEVTIHTNGTVTMRGYKNDGGNEALAVAVKAAVQGAIAGANPAP